MRVANYILSRLAEANVRHVFGVPGGAIGPLCDAFLDFPSLEYVQLHHEGAAGLAAQAQAALTGLGAVLVTAGPGTTNALSALASAWVNSSPVVFLGGQVRRAHLKGDLGVRQYGLQEIDTMALVKPLTKYAVEISEQNDIGHHLDLALFEATNGRPGPVWLSMPLDVQGEEIDEHSISRTHKAVFIGAKSVIEKAVRRTIEMLANAQFPLVLFGGGVRSCDAVELATEVIEILEIPFQTTWAAADFFENDHPFFAGRPGLFGSRNANMAVYKCDALLAIGARLDLATTAFAPRLFGGSGRGSGINCFAVPRIIVDVDESELRREYYRDSDTYVRADAKRFLKALLPEVEKHQDDARRLPQYFPSLSRHEWIEKIYHWKVKYSVPAIPPTGDKLSSYTFIDVLSDCLQEGDIIVSGSAGNYSEILMQAIKVKRGQRIIADWNLGQMGFGIPAAIGAAKSSGKRVVLIDGDGSMMPNLQELETIGRLRLPICIFVLNNGGYASIRQSQQAWFGRRMPDVFDGGRESHSCLFYVTDWHVMTLTSNTPGLKDSVKQALDCQYPIMVEVHVDPDEQRSPRVASTRAADGTMATDALEDMTPKLSREELAEEMK